MSLENEIINNPIINNPYKMPLKHWKQDMRGRPIELVDGRRPSGSYEIVPDPESKGVDGELLTRKTELPYSRINVIRQMVSDWRENGYPGTSGTTRDLLTHWGTINDGLQPYFCQREVIETIAMLCEADESSVTHLSEIKDQLKSINAEWNNDIQRYALKLATATGKTWVMAMLILWKAFQENKSTNVLILTPNITVRDRLCDELDPRNPNSLYQNLIPQHFEIPANLNVEVVNWQKFTRKDETLDGKTINSISRRILKTGNTSKEFLKESTEKMFDRILRKFKHSNTITVINDEAHHCIPPHSKNYQTGAYIWFNILESLKKQNRLDDVYDLSATPMFNKTPLKMENNLFPWTIFDYPLIDAVEAGLTKIPMVPVDDDTSEKDPIYRDLYNNLGEGEKDLTLDELPKSVTKLLDKIHENYNLLNKDWDENEPPPVLIIVANNIDNASVLYKHIAGYNDNNGKNIPGKYNIFSNITKRGKISNEPSTLLVHSKIDQLSSDSEWSAINQLQRNFFPIGDRKSGEYMGYIRSIFNTVGKIGKPGERIRCVISVSMLTEGWDARNVTHIFGFRAFDSQLLCEQVAGRALRRSVPLISSDDNPVPEYAEILGVPFDFMHGMKGNKPKKIPDYTVMTVPEREKLRINFPNIIGFRYEADDVKVILNLEKLEKYVAVKTKVPSWTKLEGLVGKSKIDKYDEPHENTIVYAIASAAINKLKIDIDQKNNIGRTVLFASMVSATRKALHSGKIKYEKISRLTMDPNFEKVVKLIVNATSMTNPEERIIPIFIDERRRGANRYYHTGDILFNTHLKNKYPQQKQITIKSELNVAPCHSIPETSMAQVLDTHKEVVSWARNYRLKWKIPYMVEKTGRHASYEPDFVAKIKDPKGRILHLVIEVKGDIGHDAINKKNAICDEWIPAVNRSNDISCIGKWGYMLLDGAITDARMIREALDNEIKKLRSFEGGKGGE